MGFHMLNAFLGAYMAFFKRAKPLIRIHALLYGCVLVCLIGFLIINHRHFHNTVWEYLIFGYFITVVPISKRWDVMLHALFATVGLTLLPVLILLQLF